MIRTILGLAELSDMSDRVVSHRPERYRIPALSRTFSTSVWIGSKGYSSGRAGEVGQRRDCALRVYVWGIARRRADPAPRGDLPIPRPAYDGRAGGTIHTLREFMENPETTRPHLHKLDPVSRLFFETQFFASGYNDTRQQILTRYGGFFQTAFSRGCSPTRATGRPVLTR